MRKSSVRVRTGTGGTGTHDPVSGAAGTRTGRCVFQRFLPREPVAFKCRHASGPMCSLTHVLRAEPVPAFAQHTLAKERCAYVRFHDPCRYHLRCHARGCNRRLGEIQRHGLTAQCRFGPAGDRPSGRRSQPGLVRQAVYRPLTRPEGASCPLLWAFVSWLLPKQVWRSCNARFWRVSLVLRAHCLNIRSFNVIDRMAVSAA
jgi:hypothetical protein